MCDIQPLHDFNVFGTRAEIDSADEHYASFELDVKCDEIKDMFQQVCLIPPSTRLGNTETCSLILHPSYPGDFLFKRMLRGDVRTLSDLPLVFESYPQFTNSSTPLREQPEWVIEEKSDVLSAFEPLRNMFSFSMGEINTHTALTFANDQFERAKLPTMRLYMLDKFGLMRPQSETLEDGTTKPLTDTLQAIISPTTVISTNGQQKYAVVDTKLYQEFASVVENTTTTWKWIHKDKSVRFCSLIGNQERLIFTTPKTIEFPSISYTLDFEDQITWTCLTQDRRFIICNVNIPNSQTSRIVVRNALTGTQMSESQPLAFRFAIFNCFAICESATFDYFKPTRMLIFTSQSTRATVELSAGGTTSTVSVEAYPPARICASGRAVLVEQPISCLFVYSNSSSSSSNTSRTVIPLHPDMTITNTSVAIAFSTTNNNTFHGMIIQQPNDSLTNGKLFVINNTTQSLTQLIQHAPSTSTLRIDDYGHLNDVNSYPFWYYGTLRTDLPVETFTIGSTILGLSRHNRRRVRLLSTLEGSSTSWPFITTAIERVNNFALLIKHAIIDTTRTTSTNLFEDGNVKIVSSLAPSNNICESNTHDRSSDATRNHPWLINDNEDKTLLNEHPIATKNGLYIMFVRHDIQKATTTVAIAYNAFNSAQFAHWCARDREYTAQAIRAQQDFCSRNMRKTNLEGSGGKFIDARCSCIGGTPLVQELFPSQTTGQPIISGRLAATLPCLLTECSESFLEGPEVTNSYLYVVSKCSQNVSLCSAILNYDGKVNLDVFRIEQNCGAEPNACKLNAECPMGTVCFNGRCVTKCSSDQICKTNLGDPNASCSSQYGVCVYGNTPRTTLATSRQIAVSGLSALFGALALIFLILLCVLVVKSNKRKRLEINTESSITALQFGTQQI